MGTWKQQQQNFSFISTPPTQLPRESSTVWHPELLNFGINIFRKLQSSCRRYDSIFLALAVLCGLLWVLHTKGEVFRHVKIEKLPSTPSRTGAEQSGIKLNQNTKIQGKLSQNFFHPSFSTKIFDGVWHYYITLHSVDFHNTNFPRQK